ncbi:MAG TPA: hypothetical protein VH302_12770 [Bryobacteraceae bacterium]|nr:hypothetical protein [Bryobacteraceae bacterium]
MLEISLGRGLLLVVGIFATSLWAAEDPPAGSEMTATVGNNHPGYYWKVEPAAETSQLLTLFCGGCGSRITENSNGANIPLLAILRDTLGEYRADQDRLLDVWLLDYANPGLGKKILSAVPFFYWHPGSGSRSAANQYPKPLFDLTTPQHPVLSDMGRDLLQWTALDPMMMPVRASSRAYRSNGIDDERLHLETAVSYLRSAPTSEEGWGLTESERNMVIARLELRKKLLGGLVTAKRAAELGEKSGYEEEQIRGRNWELLRQLAEKTGLVFEPLEIANHEGEYAMLSLPLGQGPPDTGSDLKPIWKLLGIRDPWTADRLKADPNQSGVGTRPLGVYSLTYPKLPLLLVDFRDRLRVQRHEMTQRSINEITAGVIGISHFTNWYYYVAADLYDFVSGRHGAAMMQSERLDAYSRLRMDLALDHQLDPALRHAMEARLNNVSVNPLQATADRELKNAQIRYARLEDEAAARGEVATLVDKQRRAELAQFGKTNAQLERKELFHLASFGLYKGLAPQSDDNIATLSVERRVNYQLSFLNGLATAGTQPEIAVDQTRIRSSIQELSSLMPKVDSPAVRAHAISTLNKLKSTSQSPELQTDCSSAIAAINGERVAEQPAQVPAVIAETALTQDNK